MRLLRRVCVVVAVASIASGCGGDDGDADADATATTTTSTTAPDADADGDADRGEEPPPTSSQPELSASAPGVTAEAITVGIAYIDLEAVSAFVDLDHGSYEAAYRAVIDDVNASGGVLGRRIEPVFAPIDVLDPEGADEACVRLVEDEEVFVVLGNVQAAQLPCYIDLGATPFIGSTPSDELEARARAPWFTVIRNTNEAAEVIIEGFAERGIFDGSTIGVLSVPEDESVVQDTVLPTLGRLDIDPGDPLVISTPIIFPDEAYAEVALIAERFRADGVDLVLTTGGAVTGWTLGLDESETDYRPRLASLALGTLRVFIRDRSGRDLTIIEDAVAGNQAEQLKWWDDPAIQRCIDLVEAAGEPPILDPNTRAPDEPENIVSVNAACGHVSLFVAIAERAGVDLTPESFEAAGESLGEHEVPGYGVGNWTAEAHDGDLPIFYYEWSEAARDLVNDGETLP